MALRARSGRGAMNSRASMTPKLGRCTPVALPSKLAAAAAFSRPTVVQSRSSKRIPTIQVSAAVANTDNSTDLAMDMPQSTPPSAKVLQLWRGANAICFDVDCTVTVNDSLDLLAEFMGVKEEVEDMTKKTIDGTMSLEESLESRLSIINCTPDDIRKFIKLNPPQTRLAPGIEKLIVSLQARGVDVYLVSGGFRELILPVASYLGIPPENVFANRMNWQWDDETMMPTRLIGFDENEMASSNQGKKEAINLIRETHPYNTVVMVGDSIPDLVAVQGEGGADMFIGYGGVANRPELKAQADWYVYDFKELSENLQRYRVAMVGSGAWACAVTHIVSQNCGVEDAADEFVDQVRIWGRTATDTINETKMNTQYLPNVNLGDKILACKDLVETVTGADIIIFCAPHQFMLNICTQLIGKVKPGAIAVSLVKGMRVQRDGPQLISAMVQKTLKMNCSVLMGGNIAEDVGKEQFSEAVVGYSNIDAGRILYKLFSTSYFKVNLLADPVGAEMCGTLKNIVALGAGMVDGLDMGDNTKAALLRQGLLEMRLFSKALYPSVRDDTFFECCGLGDLIATCYAGRNRKIAEAYTRGIEAGTPQTFDELEKKLLNGQKLQGVLTSDEVQEILVKKGWELNYPLFTTINRIINGKLDPSWVLKYQEGAVMRLPTKDDWLLPDIPTRKFVELY